MTVKASINQPASGIQNANTALAAPSVIASAGAPSTTHTNGSTLAPTGTPIAGSMYVRTDGTAGARVYWYYGGAWVAQTTP